jgi:hypothetical protein
MTRTCSACFGRLARQSDVLCPYCLDAISTGARRDLGLAWRAWSNVGSLAAMRNYQRALDAAVGEARMIRAQAKLGAEGESGSDANRNATR